MFSVGISTLPPASMQALNWLKKKRLYRMTIHASQRISLLLRGAPLSFCSLWISFFAVYLFWGKKRYHIVACGAAALQLPSSLSLSCIYTYIEIYFHSNSRIIFSFFCCFWKESDAVIRMLDLGSSIYIYRERFLTATASPFKPAKKKKTHATFACIYSFLLFLSFFPFLFFVVAVALLAAASVRLTRGSTSTNPKRMRWRRGIGSYLSTIFFFFFWRRF